ncbi:hypothetical protein CH275_01515 [Rhodococcus sp. 06-235-1A]|uniref:hypothetical protein n=1 Tax=Rhodococcus sp. 06-235-1A TaxID=2022508 RepID=UPI000B9ADC72|nr:hypothetical protein [Rhodococcus sp. 06-235-1A]OZD10378.1 hypothetical protein CH275_01515 [Rhodococcus sp. 06-235-1A]
MDRGRHRAGSAYGSDRPVPVLVSTLPTECFDDTDLEPIYDHAFAVTPLPGCGYIPQTFPHRTPDGALDIDAFIAAEHAAGRSYRDRVRSRVEDAGAGNAPVD